MTGYVDVHQHFLPDFYRDALAAAGVVHPDGMAKVPDWSPEMAIEAMDALGIATACVSISSPGVFFAGAEQARSLARRTNEAAAALVAAHPDRFRFFAVTPLPDVEAAIAEVEYALDELGASGVVFETNFQGVYLGDAVLDPLYRELNRRGALMFIHPTSPNCHCGHWMAAGEESASITLGYPAPMLEFMFETTRSVTQMMLSGTLERYPNLRVLVPHAGACLGALAGRIQLLKDAGPMPIDTAPTDIRKALGRLHFDLAGAPVPESLEALLHFARPDQLHYGSDWPFTPVSACEGLLHELLETGLLSVDQRAGMLTHNAHALLATADEHERSPGGIGSTT